MVPGSVIAGDDFTVAAVAKAVRKSLGEPIHYSGPGAAIWYVPIPLGGQ
jgi:hypothetical protein